jgi:uncharacterized protein YjiS (DUF1127 family)
MSVTYLKAEFFRRSERQSPAEPSFLARVQQWAEALRAHLARADQRRALSTLDERMLSDIGLSRADVSAEIAKPCWRC